MEELIKAVLGKLDDHDLLTKISVVQGGIADEMRTLARGMTLTLEDHERRIRAQEEHLRALDNRQAYWLGGMAAAAGIGGVLFKVLGGKFGI